jgi:hypothetical protein
MRSLVRESLLLVGAWTLAACTDQVPTAIDPRLVSQREVSTGLFSVGDLARAWPGEPCRTGAYRDFDFWLGDWNVNSPPGTAPVIGTNRIRSEVDGCVVAEYWAATGGLHGWSINAFDPRTGKWTQHWVAEGGGNLRLSGGLVGNAMVMSGPRTLLNGTTIIDRITWTPQSGGDVIQFWDVSFDGGLTFPVVSFNGGYVSNPGVVPSASPGSALCSTAPYASADFMIGEWDVSAQDGLELGTSSITSELSHCVLVERFANGKGYGWKAFLSYVRVPQRWYNTLVDTEGKRLELTGTGQPGSVGVSGLTQHPGGEDVNVRITYAQVSAGEFTATWETSTDGAQWSAERVLVYRRVN